MEFIYQNPVKLYHGEDQLKNVVAELKSYGDSVLLITGGQSYRANGYYQVLEQALTEENIEIFELGNNKIPSLNVVRQGIDLVRTKNIGSVVGIGGGTCMDIAKTIAFGVNQTEDVWQYLTYQAKPNYDVIIPVATIVTFPSSGSDMNGSTQITNDETNEQAGLSNIYPRFSWQNPQYLTSISDKALTSAALTSFVQLSYGYIGLGQSDIAENITKALIDTIFDNLDACISDTNNIDARSNYLTASALSINGVATIGKQCDWILYPANSVIQNYCGVDYKTSIITIFPYWLKMIYCGQPEINRYFKQVLNLDIDSIKQESLLDEAINAIFKIYKDYNHQTSFERKLCKNDETILTTMFNHLDNEYCIYENVSNQALQEMVLDAIK